MAVTVVLELGPPRLAMLHVSTFVPATPGDGVLQETGSVLFDPVTAADVMLIRLSITMASTRFLAATPVVFWRFQLMVPGFPGPRSVGMALTEREMETTGVPAGGFPWIVDRCCAGTVNEAPWLSVPLALDESVICPPCICTTTSTITTAPGAIELRLQLTFAIPMPPCAHVPCPGCAARMYAPSMVESTLLTETLFTAEDEMLLTATL